MTSDEIAAHRLHNQGLATAPFASAEAVVRWHVAMQSQEYAYAKWSIGERAAELNEAAVDRAVAEGSILRTHVLRPTWHFVAREDLRWLMELSGPRVRAFNAPYYLRMGMDDAYLARANDLLGRALEGGKQLTRRELAEVLRREGMAGDGQWLAYVMMRAELDLVVCSGAPRGKEQTYALFDERVPRAEPRDADESLAELTRRYFVTRGPATVKDYRWWSGLTAAQAKRGLDLVADGLERVEVDGRVYWLAPAEAPPREPSPTAHLLQAYDEYGIAYSESRGVMDRAGLSKVVTGRQATFMHALVVDGQLAGHWRRTASAKEMTVEVQPSRKLSTRERKAIERVVSRYGRFAGLRASLLA